VLLLRIDVGYERLPFVGLEPEFEPEDDPPSVETELALALLCRDAAGAGMCRLRPWMETFPGGIVLA
jgi:hypothetical protein